MKSLDLAESLRGSPRDAGGAADEFGYHPTDPAADLRSTFVPSEMPVMELTPTLPSSLPEAVSPPAPDSSAAGRSESEIRAAIQRVLDETERSTGRPIQPDDLLAHLLNEPGPLGRDALQAVGVKPERLRAELRRLAGHSDDNPAGRLSKERVPWPVSRWAGILVTVSFVTYPLSIGPVLLFAQWFNLESSIEGTIAIVYFPIVWLYEAVPLVEAFYDWYLKVIGYA